MRSFKWQVFVFAAAVAVLVAWRAISSATQVGDEPAAVASDVSWFTDITEPAGLTFKHDNGADGSLFLPEIMASGVALFDYDGDGDLDVYFSNAHGGLAAGEPTGEINRLFRQDRGGAFVDVTDGSGLGDDGFGMGVAVGDIDNDGDPDVYVTNLGADRLYRNNGDGTFRDVSLASGIDVDGWSCSASFLDFDNDGYLDLFITQYVVWASDRQCFSASGRRDYCGPLAFPPAHDVLLHNNQDGTFTDVTEQAGVSSVSSAGLGVTCDDFDGDGLIDIYVANDAYANNLWINQGDGRFVDRADLMGAAYNGSGLPEAGMGVVSGDFDNDGDSDLFMTHLQRETNTLYRNDGALRGFVDASGESGIGWSSLPFTGFGTVALDAELDGDLDLLVANGRVYLEPALLGAHLPPPWNQLAEPNLAYANDGTGRFGPVSETGFCSPVEISRGMAVGDIDDDGDLDFVLTNLVGPSRLYRNDAPRSGRWLVVRAVAPALNRDAIGARVSVRCGGRVFLRTVGRGYSYLSSNDPRAHFGLGDVAGIDEVVVVWPGGVREHFEGPALDQFVVVKKGEGRSR